MPLGPFSFILIFLSCHFPVRLKPEFGPCRERDGTDDSVFRAFPVYGGSPRRGRDKSARGRVKRRPGWWWQLVPKA